MVTRTQIQLGEERVALVSISIRSLCFFPSWLTTGTVMNGSGDEWLVVGAATPSAAPTARFPATDERSCRE